MSNSRLTLIIATLAISIIACKKERLLDTNSSSNSPLLRSSSFDPLALSDPEISELGSTFMDEISSSAFTERDAVEAAWCLELGLNELNGHLEEVNYLTTYEYKIPVSSSSNFTASEVEGYFNLLQAECTRIEEIPLDTGFVRIGLIDLTLGDDTLEMTALAFQSFSWSFGDYWVCHNQEEYSWTSTILWGNQGYVIHPDFNCNNSAWDNHGLDWFMTKRLSSIWRGYQCEENPQDVGLPYGCETASEVFAHTIGFYTGSGSTTAWGSGGAYSSTYPKLCPHATRSNYAITWECHDGDAVRYLIDNRIANYIGDYFDQNYFQPFGYSKMYVRFYENSPMNQNCCGNAYMDYKVYYGKCAEILPH